MQQRIPKTNQRKPSQGGTRANGGGNQFQPLGGERNQGRNWDRLGTTIGRTRYTMATSFHPIVYPLEVFYRPHIPLFLHRVQSLLLYPYLFFSVCAFLSLRSLSTSSESNPKRILRNDDVCSSISQCALLSSWYSSCLSCCLCSLYYP